MTYQVLARKWRPQDFDGIVFQDHISKTIRNSIKSGRVSHAYLFAGPRGVGKTTMARVLAKALNCTGGPAVAPCGTCENCTEIREGIAFDVIEIDGASNRGIDNIRELRENVNFAPLKSRYKVYIIDEVHMLTQEAFNALLKTLEEPPSHVVFIFATTEIHRVPDTILSRCQKYFFKKISVDAIVLHLKRIVDAEGFAVQEKALYAIARAVDGSMRDAQSLLEQALSFSEGEIGEEGALAILGVVSLASYLQMLNLIARGDRKGVMEEVDRVVSMGVDIPRYTTGFLDLVRVARLAGSGIDIRGLMGFADDEAAAVLEASRQFHDEEIGVMFRFGTALQRDLRFSGNERVVLEMALLDMISARTGPSLSSIIRRLEEAGSGSSPEPGGKAGTPPAAQHLIPSEQGGTVKAAPSGEGELTAASLESHWKALVSSLENQRRDLHVKLKESTLSRAGDTLVIACAQGALQDGEVNFIQGELKRRTGRTFEVNVEATSAASEAEHVPPPEAEMLRNPEIEEIEVLNPVVEKVRDIFHGKIIDKGEG
jgi:DNA polymerase-3 subunit gamma/tau